MHGSADIGAYIQSQYALCDDERVSVLCLRPNGKILSFNYIGEGDLSEVGISARKIAEIAIKCNASMVGLAHNHPSGLALPSAVDIEITRGLVLALRQVGVHLVDHIIIVHDDYVSMAQSPEYNHMF